MKRTVTVFDCDKCDKKSVPCLHVAIPNGSERISGGHSTEYYTIFLEKDLCLECVEKLFKFMFDRDQSGMSRLIKEFLKK